MADTMPFIAVYIVLLAALHVEVRGHQATNPLTGQHPQQVHHHAGNIPRQPEPHNQPHQLHNAEQAHHLPEHAVHTMDRNMVQNQEHIMEHLDGQIQRPEETMTEEELQFHYFKVHDYDGNNKLDGIELITALTHHHEPKPKDEGSNSPEAEDPPMSDSELSKTIDLILEENDLDKDGFIDYAEFVRNQRRSEDANV